MNRLDVEIIPWRFSRVWYRNLVVYRRIWKINFLAPLLEPAVLHPGLRTGILRAGRRVYYDGMAVGLHGIHRAGAGRNRRACGMHSSRPLTVLSCACTTRKPLTACWLRRCEVEEVIIAEIVWSATKAVAAAAIMLLVTGRSSAICDFPRGLLLIPLALLGGLAFGAIGMFFTGILPTIDMFNLPIFLFVTPMFLFSGTFFPVSNLPAWAQPAALAFPLYHLTELARCFSLGAYETPPVLSICYLLLFFLIFGVLALGAMRRRLIR